jgi:hypothetical protein
MRCFLKTHYKYGGSYAETVHKVSSHAMAIRIGHRGRGIWHRVTSFFGSLWNLVSLPTNNKQLLSSRWRFDVSLAKLSHSYAEMSSRISSKEEECASRVIGDVCRILCSTVNHSVCTLYWNKNISTFWINGAFYSSSSSSIGTATLRWVSACSTVVEHSQQEGFTECRCQRHVKPPPWKRGAFYYKIKTYALVGTPYIM